MKTKHSLFASASVLLIMLTANLVSCTKEDLRLPFGNATNPVQTSTSAASSESNAKAKKHYIGERFGGGIIFYVNSNNHGLIADVTDLPKATWAANRKLTTTGATATGIGEGRLNTNQIVAAQGIFATYAAIECDNSTRNGKSDWFLPSKDELNELFKQKEVVGNFAVTGYWSSSEIDSAYAWHQGFSIGLQGAGGKNAPINVRAIRYF